MVSNLSLECANRKVQKSWEEVELNGTHQLVDADDDSVMIKNKYRTVQKKDTLLNCNLCVAYVLNVNVVRPLAICVIYLGNKDIC